MFEQLNRVKKVQEGAFSEGFPGGFHRRRFEKGSHEGFPRSEDGFQGIGVVPQMGWSQQGFQRGFQEAFQEVFQEGPRMGSRPEGSRRFHKV